jgi:hypothetical protein
MKKTPNRVLTRPAFWAVTALQIVMTAQLWVAFQVVLTPGTSFREHLWPSAALFAAVFTLLTVLSPPIPGIFLKDDGGLNDEQTATLELALRTGVLPLASLFADWRPALVKRRRDLESGRWVGPISMVAVIALNIYDSRVDPHGVWFYWISALFYAVLGITGGASARRRLRRVRALEHQLEEIHAGTPRPG